MSDEPTTGLERRCQTLRSAIIGLGTADTFNAVRAASDDIDHMVKAAADKGAAIIEAIEAERKARETADAAIWAAINEIESLLNSKQ